MSGQALIAFRSFVALALFLGLGFPPLAAAQARVSDAYGRLPLLFEANRGQTHDEVRFLSRGPGYSLYLTAGEAVLALPGPVALRMSLAGASAEAHVSGLEELAGKANYFIGRDPAKWRTNVPTYAKVEYRGVYPGIDLVYYGNQRQLEYDFIVAPGADPQRIVLDFKGVEKLEIDAQGDLVMHAAGGALRQHKPVIYQAIDGVRRQVAGGYVIKDAHQVAFQVAAYDQARPLVIDPVLSYSTYLGGAGIEEPWTIAVDATGNAYVTGSTNSINFPTTAGALDTSLGGSSDVFVTKLNATGTALVYSTYLGGSATEGGAIGVAVDSAGNAYVTGGTLSADFPTTPGALQTTAPGGGDAFVTKLNAAGSALVYSTYLGGTGHEGGFFRIAVDTLGNAYVAGHTDSTDFPTTPGAFQRTFAGSNVTNYVTKLNATGSALVYSSFLGGSSIPFAGSFFKEGIAIAVDSAGSAYVAGGTTSNTFPTTPLAFQPAFGGGLTDAFVTKLDPTGSVLVYSTYLGGSVNDEARGVAVDATGNAYVTGSTGSGNFPLTAEAFDRALGGNVDAFVTKLNAAGSALVYSTYLGGSGIEGGESIALNAFGEAHVAGATTSSDFPTVAAAQATFGGGFTDAFVTKFNAAGSALAYSTYLGGTGNDDGLGVALDSAGSAYVTGQTDSTNFPTTPGAFQTSFGGGLTDAFVAKFAEATPPAAGTAGKVTGGGTINVAGGIGNFGLNVNRDAANGPIDGHLQYANHASGAQVRSVTFTTFAASGNTATFGGTCTSNGAPCTFTVNVADNGEPGRNDSFEITVDAAPAQGGTLRGGNIQVHKPKRSK
jgi:hypothetical protein